jgi:outer membrane receptor protein involved in Fe transport
VVLVTVAVISLAAWAQAETGQILGTVTDPKGAVVPGATVTVKSVERQTTRSTTTNQSGLYTVANLQPGNYDVTIEAPGFGTFTRRVVVSPGFRQGVDAQLTVAGAETVVEVTAAAATSVNTESQTIGRVVTGQEITQLPTITRDPYDLVATAGNISQDPDADQGGGATTERGVGFSINGQRSASTNILLDGGENVDNFDATLGQSVPLDSVQEFTVLTSNYSAEFGRASGGIVNVATKAGTNDFHGTVYEFYRGAALAANTPENKAQGDPRGNFVRNQFGYLVTGPIVKDKIFFSQSTEWIRVRSADFVRFLVPTPEFIGAAAPATQAFMNAYGALSATPTGATVTSGAVQGTNPSPGAAWAGLGANFPVFTEVARPIPTDAGGGDPQNTYLLVGRVDINFTDATSLYVRYGREKGNLFAGTVSFSPFQGFDTGQETDNHNALISLTHLFTPSLVSQSKVIYNRLDTLQPINGTPTPTLFFADAGGLLRFGGVRTWLPGYLPGSPGSGIPFGGPQNLYQFYQDMNWTTGRHQFRFGGNYIHMRDNREFGAYEEASEILGSSLLDGLNRFLTGQLTQFFAAVDPQGKFPCHQDFATGALIQTPECTVDLPVGQPSFKRNNRFNDFALYVQDSWKVRPTFTLNIGLRYEYFGVQHNADPRLDSNFYFGEGANFFERYRNGQVMIAEDSPVGGLWEPDWNNLAPRIGFAWDIFGNAMTALRGGYGISYERNFGNVTFNVIQNPPNYFVITLTPPDVGGNLPVSVDNAGPLSGDVGSKALPTSGLRHVSEDIETAYAQFWSLALDHRVLNNSLVALEYTGSRGIKLYSLETFNRLGAGVMYLGDDPNVNPFTRLHDQYGVGAFNRDNRGFSYYNGLNVRFQTPNLLESGLGLNLNYTWAHAIDNLSSTFSDSFANFNTGLLDPFNPALDKGHADFDVRHRFVASALWEMPFFKDSDNWFLQNIVGGWSLAPIVTVRSGTPFTMYDCTNGVFYCARLLEGGPADTSNRGTAVQAGPGEFAPNLYNYLEVNSAGNYFNPLIGTSEFGLCDTPGQAATQICPYPANMVSRNSFRGPSNWNTTLGLYKNLRVTERVGLQFRGEFFNIFNHANHYIDNASIDVAAGNSVFTKQFDKRDIQLGLKLTF